MLVDSGIEYEYYYAEAMINKLRCTRNYRMIFFFFFISILSPRILMQKSKKNRISVAEVTCVLRR